MAGCLDTSRRVDHLFISSVQILSISFFFLLERPLYLNSIKPTCEYAQVTEASTVELVKSGAPAIKLDDKHYKLVDKVFPVLLRLGKCMACSDA